MKKVDIPASELLLRFVRGDEEWDSLRSLGIAIEIDGAVRLEIPPSCPTVEPLIEDVASGLLKLWVIGGERLRRWAAVLLALTNVDLIALEAHDEGDTLLSALWDAAGGGPVSSSSIHVARRVIEKG
jgi:hypothetical protein